MRRQPQSIILYAFDLLHLDGKDLRQQTLMERRRVEEFCCTDERSPHRVLAMSLMGMVMPASKPALSGNLKALSPNTHSHPIGLGEARLGSRPNASPNRPLW